MAPLTRRTVRMGAAVLLAAALAAAGGRELTRAGYSPDEEFTVFATRGIAAHGLPLLPSGLLYDRGVAYSYAARLAQMAGGGELAPARGAGLVFALLALGALWTAVRVAAREAAAWLAVLLVASSVPFWVVATSARFYAPFLALYLAALAVLVRIGQGTPHPSRLAVLLILSAAARLTHELAFTLAVIPAACALLAPRGRRGAWVAAGAAVVAGLTLAQAGLFALHFLAPASGGTMIRRFFLWQVLNLFARPPAAAPVGALLVAGFAALLVGGAKRRPWRGLRHPAARVALPAAGLVLAWGAVASFDRSFEYPLDLFWHLARTQPLLVVMVLALAGLRALGHGGHWMPAERAAHLCWLGWVVFFGVIESGITVHYLLMPVTLMLAAVAVDVAAVFRHQGSLAPGRGLAHGPARVPRRQAFAAVVLALILPALAISSWGRRPHGALAAARPTIVVPAGAELPRLAASAPVVACTDELACLLLAGRVDQWLALDDFLRDRFVVSRGGADVGVYAGAPAVYRLRALFDTAGREPPARVLVVDVFKDLPVGPSSVFLDRALAAEAVPATTLSETPQLRILELRSDRPSGARMRDAAHPPGP